MFPLLKALLLGVVQGITECLPVSSSGHLVIAERILGIEASGVAFEAFLHLGTMGAALLYFRKIWSGMILSPLSADSLRLVCCLVIATAPVAAAGYLSHDAVSRIFHDYHLVLFNLILTGLFLVAVSLKKEGGHGIDQLRAIFIGMAQAAALLPGVSRSGMTIGSGMLAGMRRFKAVEFAFLLAVPAILGASVFELGRLEDAVLDFGICEIIPGLAASFVSGYLSIGLLVRVVKGGRFRLFGYYCVAAGITGFLWT